MKKLSFVLFLLLTSFSVLAQSNRYTIKGTGEDIIDGDTVYLCAINGFFAVHKLDSTIVWNGEYHFSGSYPDCDIRYIMPIRNGKYTGFSAIMLENADITVHSYSADKKKDADVTGGPNFQLWRDFKTIQKRWSEEMVPHWLTTRDSLSTLDAKLQAQHHLDSLTNLQKEEEFQFMLTHLPAPYCNLILGSDFKSFSSKQKEMALAAFKEKYPESANYKRLSEEMKASAAIEIGKKYIDFSMPDPNGKTISIGEIVKKNKFTLIDFWASWCGPCRAEMPHVVAAYHKYHDRGFEVIGVSLDNKQDAWVKAIETLNMPWPQMSDLKAWQSEGAKLYNVKAIPSNVLIDRKGKIVARDLRGLTLINKIGEFLK